CVFEYCFDARYVSVAGKWQYWGSLGTLLVLSLIALKKSASDINTAWQKKKIENAYEAPRGISGGGIAAATRSRLLEVNPICWLGSRDVRPRVSAFVVLGVGVPIVLILALISLAAPVALAAALVMAYLVHHALKWLVAIEASRRLSEDRRNGTLELLLVAPLLIDDIVRGQILALRRQFRTPLFICASMNGILLVRVFAGIATAGGNMQIILAEVLIGGAVLLFVDFSVLAWVGMWMGMVAKRHHRAVFATLARVIVVPWGANLILVLISMGGLGLSFQTAAVLLPFWFGLAAVLGFAFR